MTFWDALWVALGVACGVSALTSIIVIFRAASGNAHWKDRRAALSHYGSVVLFRAASILLFTAGLS